MIGIVILFLFVVGVFLWVSFRNIVDEEVKKHKEDLDRQYEIKKQKIEDYAKKQHEDLIKILSTSAEAFPFVAGLAADYLTWDYYFVEDLLGRGYKPERVRAIKIREMHESTKSLLAEYKTASYQLAYLQKLFPDLTEYIDDDERISDPFQVNAPYHIDDDPAKEYLSVSEYNTLSENERNQRALDNYISSHSKTKWQIGRDYELYVGHRLSEKGFSVVQVGILEKFADMGRDIIAVKNDLHYVIQCKYWSSNKIIHEKHIAQLYGTAVCYALEQNIPLENVKPVFYTNIDFSDTAKRFADALSVKLIPSFELGEYPRIKCKVGYDEFGKTYIFHLPMDQQYDITKINTENGDMYAFTVEEAVSYGFRRAYRWHGHN